MSIKINSKTIRYLMLKNGYNNTDLAKELCICKSYLGCLLKNEKQPSPKLAKKFTKVLGVEFDEIFKIEGVE
ncbi:helix-turn-helix transcriptional regulator [Staphylococcus pasteuri]|uniref:helix-turn-helix transcriptional regulator n=1 Tax=Staphylococcus pasteuri TaxID=45972 RepID=UPI001E364805|nr:helix-turn-helix transcriptional regulator [Staphylococcus pasteuri]MCE3022730.1 helix-turn-helix domain-containing protein [Staphylococcus pasteuri]